MSLALLEMMAPSRRRRVCGDSHALFGIDGVARKRTTVNPKGTLAKSWPKKRFFQAEIKRVPENGLFPGTLRVCNEDERL
jgi:hypothetical protein